MLTIIICLGVAVVILLSMLLAIAYVVLRILEDFWNHF